MFFCFFFSASACLGGRNQQSYDVGGKNSIFSLFFGTHTHLKKKGKNSLTVFFFITRGGSLFIGTLFVVADQVVYDNEDRGGRLSRTIDLLLFFFGCLFFFLSSPCTYVDVYQQHTRRSRKKRNEKRLFLLLLSLLLLLLLLLLFLILLLLRL